MAGRVQKVGDNDLDFQKSKVENQLKIALFRTLLMHWNFPAKLGFITVPTFTTSYKVQSFRQTDEVTFGWGLYVSQGFK